MALDIVFNKILLVAVAISLLMFSCKKENMGDCIKGTGEVVSEDTFLDDFDSLIVENDLEVILIPDTLNKARIEAGSNLQSYVKILNNDGRLTLSNTVTCNFVRGYQNNIKIFLHYKSLHSLHMKGIGQVSSAGYLNFNIFTINNTSSGDVTLAIKAKHLYLKTFGMGNITINGYATNNEIHALGHGFIFCQNLISENSYVYSRTTGNIHVVAERKFGAKLEDAGNVYYYGNPQIEYLNENSSGKVFKVE
jgi:hypothetical protein